MESVMDRQPNRGRPIYDGDETNQKKNDHRCPKVGFGGIGFADVLGMTGCGAKKTRRHHFET